MLHSHGPLDVHIVFIVFPREHLKYSLLEIAVGGGEVMGRCFKITIEVAVEGGSAGEESLL